MNTVEPATTKRKRLRKDDRARQLLDLAEDLFIQHGYEAVTLEDVARLAGVTRPVVYEHYGSKEGLFLACAKRAREDFEHEMTQAVASAKTTELSDVLAQGGEVFFRTLEENPRRWSLLFGATLAESGELADQLLALRAQTIDRIAKLMLVRAPAKMDPATIEACAFAISGVGEQLGRWWQRHPDLPRSVVVQHYKTFIVGGLQAITDSTPPLNSIATKEHP